MSLGVGLGDLLVVSDLAWRLFKACKESSEDFRKLSTELMGLQAVLREAEEYIKEYGELDISRRNRLEILCQGCREVLADLEGLVNRYETLGTQAQRTWDRMRFGLKDLSDIRSRLISSTTMLNAFTTILANSSTVRIQRRLTKFMTEVQAGLREGSVVTIPDVSESIDSQDVWTELRRELEDVGINEAVVEENREFISSWVKAAISGGQLDEAPLENQPFSSSKPRKPSVAAFSYSGYGSADETETLAPSVMSLNIANDEFEEELRKQRLDRPLDDILDYMVTQQVAEPSVKLRKKSDPGRLLQKLFQKNTAIIQAASDGDVDKVAKLIGLGVDVNARDRWGWSALSMCGYGGHKTIARLLLDHGADLDNVDVDDDTPTGLATQRGHTDLVIMFDEERARRDLRLREMCQEKPRRPDPVQFDVECYLSKH